MIERVIIAGSGGQGIMLFGKILATAAMKEDKFVTWLPSYGAEVRGGTAHCMVVISDDEIGSPFIEKADTLIAMNKPSLDKFKNRLKTKGMMIFNSSLAEGAEDENKHIFKHPFTEIAITLGNIKIANMVALGSFIANKKIVGVKSALQAISDFAPPSKKDLVEINIKALQEGVRLK